MAIRFLPDGRTVEADTAAELWEYMQLSTTQESRKTLRPKTAEGTPLERWAALILNLNATQKQLLRVLYQEDRQDAPGVTIKRLAEITGMSLSMLGGELSGLQKRGVTFGFSKTDLLRRENKGLYAPGETLLLQGPP